MDGLYCHYKESDLYDENTEKLFCNIATLEKFNFCFFCEEEFQCWCYPMFFEDPVQYVQ